MRQISLGLCHASAVSIDEKAILILGSSGAGKSSLALRLMGLGATLVADDQTMITKEDNQLLLSPADGLAGLIEARHVGILSAEFKLHVPLKLVVDLDIDEKLRLPKRNKVKIDEHSFDLVHGKGTSDLEFGLFQWMKAGRFE